MTVFRLEVLMFVTAVSPMMLHAPTFSRPATTTPSPTNECTANDTSSGIRQISIGNSRPWLNCSATDFNFSVRDATVAENDGQVELYVTRNKPGIMAGVLLTVTINAANFNRAVDPFRINLVFERCVVIVKVFVPVKDDCKFERITEKYRLKISDPNPGALWDSEGILTVLDNDVAKL